jgi:predicted ATPase
MQELHALALDVVRPYRGQLQPMMGDRLLIFFGAPTAHEDDARRAVRVALELQQRLAARQEQLETGVSASWAGRMGLHTGMVVVDRKQDDAELATMVGDVLSVALGLQEQAAPGQILCSATTARLVQWTVRLAAVEPIAVAGQPTPVTTYAVHRHRGRRALGWDRWERVLSPFVGREREMATLQALLAQVEAGRGQVAGVVGDPGLGKSRLLYEFRRSLEGRRLTYRAGRCFSYGSTTPYLPVLDLLRHHCGIADADGPEDITAKIHRSLQEVDMALEEWAPVLLHLVGLEEGTNPLAALSPEVYKARILAALTQICLNGSRQRPIILEIEDLHWIDASSDECLTALVERMAGAPILVLVTYRPGYRPAWMDRSYVTQIALQPLTSQDSLRVVQAVLPTVAPSTPLVPQLVAQAEGNPFFLEELARTVVEQGSNAPSLTVPDTIQAVLLARIDRLPATAKRLLQTAAVIGKDVALPLLQAVTDVPEEVVHRELGHLQVAEFLYETYAPGALVYAFKHALTQEVAYQSLVRRVRQQYHARIAQVLEKQFPEVAESQPEFLAQHYTEAGLAEQAIPYWQRAGQRAMERSATSEAVSHFTKGLEVLQSLPESSERVQHELALHLALGAPLWTLKGHAAPEVEQVYNQTLQLCQQVGDISQRFSVLAGLWRFYLARAKLDKARELAEQCAILAPQLHAPVFLLEAHLMLGSTLFFRGELVSGHEHLEQGIALYNPRQGHTRAFSRATDPGVDCLCRSAWVLCLLGYPDRALARSRKALVLAKRLSHAHSLAFASFYVCVLHQFRRETQAVLEQAAVTITLAQEGGFGQWLTGGMVSRDWARADHEPTEENIAQLCQSLAAWHATGVELGNSRLFAILAGVYTKVGQAAAGLRVLTEALALVHKNAEHYYDAELYRLRAELLLLQAIPDEGAAENSFQLALDIAHHQRAKLLELRAAIHLSQLWQQQGKREQARQVLTEIYGWFTEGFQTPDLQEARALLDALR